MDLVSILVPCYNHEKFVADCMRSIMAQTYENIEVIICDDCSVDNSFSVIKEYEETMKKRFKRVVIMRNEANRGITKNLNGMLEHAQGEYIKLIASDDMLAKDAIENLVAYAKVSGADIVYSNMRYVGNDCHYPVGSVEKLKPFYTERPPVGGGLIGNIYANNFIAAPSVIFPKATFDKFGNFDEEGMTEDLEYWLRVATEGKFDYLDCCTVFYRLNENSLSHYKPTKEGIEKNRRFHSHLCEVHKRYDRYVTDHDRTVFYNNELAAAMRVRDKELTLKFFREMRDKGMPIYKENITKMALLYLGLYGLARKVLADD